MKRPLQPANFRMVGKSPSFRCWVALLCLVLLPARGAVNRWVEPGDGFWDQASNWSGGIPAAGDDVVIEPEGITVTYRQGTMSVATLEARGGLALTGGRLEVSGMGRFDGKLLIDGGELGGAGVVRVLAEASWRRGAMIGAGRTIIEAGATITLSSDNDKFLGTRTIENRGTLVWQDGGSFRAWDGARLENFGVMEVRNDREFGYVNFGGAIPVFLNRGTFRKTGTSGETRLYQQDLRQEGVFEVLSGTLRTDSLSFSNRAAVKLPAGVILKLQGGTQFTCGAGGTFEGPGILRLESGANLVMEADAAVANFSLAGGRVTGPGTLELAAVAEWSSGNMESSGRTRVGAGATLTLVSDNDKFLGTRTLENLGTLVWLGGGSLRAWDGARLENLGLIEARNDREFGYVNFGGPAPTFLNRGTFRKLGTTGETRLYQQELRQEGVFEILAGVIRTDGLSFSNRAAVKLAPGAVLRLQGDTRFFCADGGTIQGTGKLRVESGAVLGMLADVSVANLELAGGRVNGPATLVLEGAAQWLSGNMEAAGRTRIAPGAVLTLDSDNDKFLGTRTLENRGTVVWQGGGSLRAWDAARLENFGQIEIRNDREFGYVNFGGAAPTLLNRGTIRKSGTVGETRFYQQELLQEGVLEISTGAMRIDGLTATHRGAVRLSGGSILRLQGGTRWAVAAGGAFEGPGALRVESGSNLEVVNEVAVPNLDLAGGRITGAGTLVLSQTAQWLSGNMEAAGRTILAAGATLALVSDNDKFLGTRTLENRGTIVWRDGGSIRAWDSARIENRGVFEARTDREFGYVNFGGGPPTFVNEGVFRKTAGAGTTRLYQQNFRQEGTLEVVNGTVRFESTELSLGPTNTVALEIRGRTPGAELSQVTSDRPVTLSGNLRVNLANGFAPETNEFLTVFTASALTGFFAESTASGGEPGIGIRVDYQPGLARVQLDPAPLRVLAAPSTIREDSAPLRWRVVRREAGPEPLVVALAALPSDRLLVPASVTIPAGAATAEFDAQPVRDGLPGTDLPILLRATAPGVPEALSRLTLVNVDTDVLRLVVSTNRVAEGSTLAATISRSGPGTQPVGVFLTSSDSSRLIGPGSVVIESGQASKIFTVIAPDDSQLTGNTAVSLTATAPTFQPTGETITVLENDVPSLTVKLSRSVVSENAGANAVVATVSRSPAGPGPLAVQLASSHPEVLLVPANVSIPPGMADVSFPVAVVDDPLVNGTRPVVVTPTIDVGGGLRLDGTEATLEVTDDDGPALFVSVSPTVVGEGILAAALGRVTRNDGTNGEVVVHLSSSAPAESVVPATVTIPAGTNAATFVIGTLDDGVVDGSQTVRIGATAEGRAPGEAALTVTDSSLPDLAVNFISAPAEGDTEAGGQTTYRVLNQGRTPAIGPIRTRLYLSNDPLLGGDTLLAEHSQPGTVAPGASFDTAEAFFLPRAAGAYWLIAVTDAGNDVGELLEDNNTTVSASPIQVGSAYVAAVETDIDRALAGTPIPLRGRAFLRNSISPAPFALVSIHVMLGGSDRVIAALADEDGNFTATFQPLPGEAGDYAIAATHPGTKGQPEAQDRFTLLGFSAAPSPVEVALVEKSSATNTVVLENLSDLPLTGLAAVVSANNLPNVEVATYLDATAFAPAGSVTLTVVATARDASFVRGNAVVHLSTVEGAVLDLPVNLSVQPLLPRLVADPANVVAGVKRGQLRSVEVRLRNDGGLPSGPLTVSLPPLPWLAATPSTLPSLAPGESAAVTLLLTPSEDVPLGFYPGQFAVLGALAGISVPVEFRVLSDARGDLEVSAVDEFTYYAEGSPKVTNAVVRVKDALTGLVVAEANSGTNGVATFAGLNEGFYDVDVTADGHTAGNERLFLEPGVVNTQDVFVTRRVVEYRFTVVPSEIEDRTKITLETTFETFVPAPVITVTPSMIDLAEVRAPEDQIVVLIENHGLVAAKGADISFDTGNPIYEITPLVTNLGDIPARGSVAVPVRIRTRVPGADAGPGRSHARPQSGAKPASILPTGGDCGVAGRVRYILICGPFNNLYQIPLGASHSGCQTYPPNFGGDGGGGGGGGGGSIPGGTYPGCPNCQPRIQYVDPPIASTNGCQTCNTNTFHKKCGEIEVGAKIDATSKTVKAAMAAVGIKFAADGKLAAKVKGCTCCTSQGAISLEGSASACATATATFTIPLAGVPPMVMTNDLPDGSMLVTELNLGSIVVDVPLKAELCGTIEGNCGLEKERICVTAKVSGGATLKAGIGISAKAIDKDGNTIPIQGAKAEASLGGGVSAVGTYCTDGTLKGEVCIEPVVAEISGEVTLGTYSTKLKASYEIVPKKCKALGDANAPADFLADAEVQVHIEADTRPAAGATAPAPARRAAQPASAGKHGDPSGGLCATVKIQLDQEAVLTRNAFNATLELTDNDPAAALENVEVLLSVTDADGNNANELFGIRDPQLKGLTGVDRTGRLAPDSTGSASWILIPTRDAAPETNRMYFVGGFLGYDFDGRRVTVPLTSVPIEVRPDPALVIQYFHQRDVFSDDPFSPAIEPAQPFNLGVLVANRGRGVARNFRITSAQPRIVDNEKGLLIDFQLIGTEVAGRNFTPSLTAAFGDIGPGTNQIARFLFTSSLQGLFTDYKATFEHLDGINGKRLSLIDAVSIHEMTHLVEAAGRFDDGRPDFLVNDVIDLDTSALPDTLYLSDGSTNEVAAVLEGTFSPSGGGTQVALNVLAPKGWVYLRLPEPNNGARKLRRVLRSDGVEIRLERNVWITDRTFLGLGLKPLNEHRLNLLDLDSTGAYTLDYSDPPAADTVPPTSRVADLPASSPQQIPLRWNGSDDSGGSGVAFFDVLVSVDNGPFETWQSRTRNNGALYPGQRGHSYAFRTRATDFAGNVEILANPVVPDATTTVTLEDTAPLFPEIADQTSPEDAGLSVSFVVSDPDTALEALTFSIQSSNPVLLASNSGRVTGSGTNRVLQLTPMPNASGTVAVTLSVSDGNHVVSHAFRWTISAVNDAPVAGTDVIVRPDCQAVRVGFAQLLANDADPEFDALRITAVSPASTLGGTVALGRRGITYTPPAGTDAEDRFTYTVSDGKLSSTGEVIVRTAPAVLPPTPGLLTVVVCADSKPVIRFRGVPGMRYEVQVSGAVDPVHWISLATVQAAPDGIAEYADNEATPDTTRFYRVVETR